MNLKMNLNFQLLTQTLKVPRLACLVLVVLALFVYTIQVTSNLTDFIFFLLGSSGVVLTGILALYYAHTNDLNKPFPLWLTVFALVLILGLSSYKSLVTELLLILRSLFIHPYWQLFGIILALLVFMPLIVQALRYGLKNKRISDFIVIGGFLLFVFLLYLPFGFESIGHWEEWIFNAYWEGGNTKWHNELVSRFWALVPHSLAYIISSESFIGYHLINFLMFWGKLVLLYGILRQIKILPCLYAFLITMLFMVYPVNPGLMLLRSLSLQFSMLSLLAAVYLVLDYQKNPTRLHLLGIWLGLMFNVTTVESAYVIILVIPLSWLLLSRRLSWRNFNLTVIWYLFPAFKIAYLMLLLSASKIFYGSDLFGNTPDGVAPDVFNTFLRVMSNVYRYTFVDGWQDALTALEQNTWLALTIVMLALVSGIAWYLAHTKGIDTFLSVRQIGILLISGLLFIMPSVGVLVWLERYNSGLWRMYFYVPIGAAIAVFSLIALLAAPIVGLRYRNATIVVLCLTLMFPALSRLILQHERFVTSANNKAIILHDILEIAPQIEPDTHLIIAAQMTKEQFEALDIFELSRAYVIHSAFHVLHQDHAPPAHSQFCLRELTWVCSRPHVQIEPHLQNTLLFKINKDLSVELVEQPSVYFGFESDPTYDSNRLYHRDAPLPPRASTMLGSALLE